MFDRDWEIFAKIIGIEESEIEHWQSQQLQYPMSRVISAWCTYGGGNPTVAQLHSILSSDELNRKDLARFIEQMYVV
ncbi:unnamed protein product [Didymodactylos carnosus]|uniref:Death domain-containing protein n=1 Tax=Didymodactylos carnosus TaxID=1234261 RepID=A0A8S2VAK4_9BILA|nr:unnamed protein product [Didymodactylos carnosus]CAF4374550.1 unnamed protein product [Didymodactylos carnosus]